MHWLFVPDFTLDRWTLVHLLIGIVVGYVVQHINYAKMAEIHERISDRFIEQIKPHLKHLPHELQKVIDLKKLQQPLALRFDLSTVLLVAYIREAFEHYFELGYVFPNFSTFIPGQEHWLNRLILDPLMLVIGYGIVRKYPQLRRPALVLCVALFFWLLPSHVWEMLGIAG